MGRADEGGWLSRLWVCCVCGWRGPAGSMDWSDEEGMLRCDKCRSADVHPIERGVLNVDCYMGCVGPLH